MVNTAHAASALLQACREKLGLSVPVASVLRVPSRQQATWSVFAENLSPTRESWSPANSAGFLLTVHSRTQV